METPSAKHRDLWSARCMRAGALLLINFHCDFGDSDAVPSHPRRRGFPNCKNIRIHAVKSVGIRWHSFLLLFMEMNGAETG